MMHKNKQLKSLILTGVLLVAVLLSSCRVLPKPTTSTSTQVSQAPSSTTSTVTESTGNVAAALEPVYSSTDRYRSFYEIFVYSFADSNGDGIGDLKGLAQRLDYINDGNPTSASDLGFDGIWLMPICPSPTYHKYDVTDYKAIDPQYGELEDFKNFLAAADERGIKVVIDLVLNHSSTQHPWFIQATQALAKGELENPYIGYYHFSREKKSEKYYDVPAAPGWFYEAVFWDQMPDLAVENAALRDEIIDIVTFWLDLGVFGFRLDAVTQFYTGEDQRNIDFLKWLNEETKKINPEAYYVAEAWSDVSTYTKYYASGIDSLFDFAMADSLGRLAAAVNSGDGQLLMQQMQDTEAAIKEQNPQAINAVFLSNHDMGRAAGYFASDTGKMKLAAALYLMASGDSYTYYGEEIGMRGSGRDENKRAPMLWSAENATAAADQTHGPTAIESSKISYPNGSVAEQLQDPDSLLNFYIQALRLKNAHPLIARGESKAVKISDDKSLVALSKSSDGREKLLLVYNFSAESKKVALVETYAGANLAGSLCATESVKMEAEGWLLPGYSMALFILK